jgi:hypothetical protein
MNISLLSLFLIVFCIILFAVFYYKTIYEEFTIDKYNIFKQSVKKDFDLDILSDSIANYSSNNLVNIALNKSLSNFSIDDVYKCICFAYINSNNLRTLIIEFYQKYLNDYEILHREYIYSNIDELIKDVRLQNVRTIDAFYTFLNNPNNSNIKSQYSLFIKKFYTDNIYIYTISSHPLANVDLTFRTYIDKIRIDTNISNEYKKIISIIKNIIKNDRAFNIQNEFKKQLIDLIDITKIVKSKIDTSINTLLQSDSNCWIQNNGNLNVKMRECNVYYTRYRNMCNRFENLYELSAFQLKILLKSQKEIFKKIGGTNVNIYDTFIDLINKYDKSSFINKEGIENIKNEEIKSEFINILNSIYKNISKDNTNILIKELVEKIYNLNVIYAKKSYKCLDIYRIYQQKKNNDNLHVCKISIPGLKEIYKDTQYEDVVEGKVLNFNHINPTELWGSCFYTLDYNNSFNARNNIIRDMNEKYNIVPSCDNNIIENIKDINIPEKQNKYLAFNTDSYNLNRNQIEIMKYPHDIFLRIKIKDNLYDIEFVKYNIQAKNFYVIKDVDNINLRKNLYDFTEKLEGKNNELEYSINIVPKNANQNFHVITFNKGAVYKCIIKNSSCELSKLLKNVKKGYGNSEKIKIRFDNGKEDTLKNDYHKQLLMQDNYIKNLTSINNKINEVNRIIENANFTANENIKNNNNNINIYNNNKITLGDICKVNDINGFINFNSSRSRGLNMKYNSYYHEDDIYYWKIDFIGTEYDLRLYSNNEIFIYYVLDGTNLNTLVPGMKFEGYKFYFSLQFKGYFLTRNAGYYTFFTRSDDSSLLWIGVNINDISFNNVTVNNSGEHSEEYRSGRKYLEANTLYTMIILYGNNKGAYKFSFGFSLPNNTSTILYGDGYYYSIININDWNSHLDANIQNMINDNDMKNKSIINYRIKTLVGQDIDLKKDLIGYNLNVSEDLEMFLNPNDNGFLLSNDNCLYIRL